MQKAEGIAKEKGRWLVVSDAAGQNDIFSYANNEFSSWTPSLAVELSTSIRHWGISKTAGFRTLD
jgi:hypothetical protein